MDVSRCPLGVGRDAGASASAPDGLATRAGDTNGLLRKKIAALREANLSLRIENSDLKVANGSLAQEKQAILAALAGQMSENQRSLGWMLIQKARSPPPAFSGGPTFGSVLGRSLTVRASHRHGRSR